VFTLEEIVCPICGAPLEKGAKKCPVCGEEFEHGLDEDTLYKRAIQEFMKLPGIGSARARAIYESGVRSLADLKKASETGKLKGVGKKVGEAIKEELSEEKLKESGLYICSNCGAFMSASAKQCPRCGAIVVEEEEAADEGAEEIVEEEEEHVGLYICPTCGAFVSEEAKYCPHCGTVLADEEEVADSVSLVDSDVDIGVGGEPVSFGPLRVCKKCGAFVKEESDRCPICGAEIRGEDDLVQVAIGEVFEEEEEGVEKFKEVLGVEGEIPPDVEEESEGKIVLCPHCGAFTPEKGGVCPICGGDVGKGVEVEKGEIKEEEKMHDFLLCPNCGAFLSEGAKTCPICGEVVGEAVRPEKGVEKGEEEGVEALETFKKALGVETLAPSSFQEETEEVGGEILLCPICGAFVSEKSTKCPICGYVLVEGGEGVEEVEEVESAAEMKNESMEEMARSTESAAEGVESVERASMEGVKGVAEEGFERVAREGVGDLEEERFAEEVKRVGEEEISVEKAGVEDAGEVEVFAGLKPLPETVSKEKVHVPLRRVKKVVKKTLVAPKMHVGVMARGEHIPSVGRGIAKQRDMRAGVQYKPPAPRKGFAPKVEKRRARPTAVRTTARGRPSGAKVAVSTATSIPLIRRVYISPVEDWERHRSLAIKTSSAVFFIALVEYMIIRNMPYDLLASFYVGLFIVMAFYLAIGVIISITGYRIIGLKHGEKKMITVFTLSFLLALFVPVHWYAGVLRSGGLLGQPVFDLVFASIGIVGIIYSTAMMKGRVEHSVVWLFGTAVFFIFSVERLARFESSAGGYQYPTYYLPSVGVILLVMAYLQHIAEHFVKERVETRVMVGHHEYARKRIDRAKTIYEDVLRKMPDEYFDEEPMVGKASALLKIGKLDEAFRDVNRAIEINPSNEAAWNLRGLILSKMGRLEDALRAFNRAIEINPRYEVAWNNKGNLLARMGRYDEALECYNTALRIEPRYKDAWINKGYVLVKLGRYDDAMKCADMAKKHIIA